MDVRLDVALHRRGGSSSVAVRTPCGITPVPHRTRALWCGDVSACRCACKRVFSCVGGRILSETRERRDPSKSQDGSRPREEDRQAGDAG